MTVKIAYFGENHHFARKSFCAFCEGAIFGSSLFLNLFANFDLIPTGKKQAPKLNLV